MSKNGKVPDPLSDDALEGLRALIRAEGEYGAAERLKMPRSTVCRAAAGAGIRAATAAVLRTRVEEWVSERALDAIKAEQGSAK